MKKYQLESGSTLLIIIVIVVPVFFAALGFATWRILESKSKPSVAISTNKAISSENSPAKQIQGSQIKTCNEKLNDTDYCQFAVLWDSTTVIKANISNNFTSAGTTETASIEKNGNDWKVTARRKDNSISSAIIYVGGQTYTSPDGVNWYDARTTGSVDIKNPLDEYEFLSNSLANKMTLKKIGLETVGKTSAIKYQAIYPAESTTKTVHIWVDPKTHTLIKRTENNTSYTSDVTYEYPAKLDIKKPEKINTSLIR